MRIRAAAASDASNLILFFPEHLPEDADEVLRKDPVSLVEKLGDEGKLIWFPTVGEPEYKPLILIDEELPGDVRQWITDEEVYPDLHAQGPAYFAGMEFVFKEDDSRLREAPEMGARVAIDSGIYAAKLSSFNYALVEAAYIAKNLSRFGKTVRFVRPFLIAFAVLWLWAGIRDWWEWGGIRDWSSWRVLEWMTRLPSHPSLSRMKPPQETPRVRV